MKTKGRMRNHASRILHHGSRLTFHASRITFHVSRSQRAFTMVEIAISLAIIGFAMVAIIGVLPIGMNVQKDNREETIINQDATVFQDAIRNGAQGLDDLTNYVMAITNWVTPLKPSGLPSGPPVVYAYTYNGSWQNGTSLGFPITNGLRIIGLLSTPKYMFPEPVKGQPSVMISNYVVAYVRSMSGPAYDKSPQNNPSVQDLAFSYRMTSEVIPYWTNYFDPSWTSDPAFRAVASNLQTNLHDVRLIFRWPLLPKGRTGNGGQAFRTLVGGSLLQTNEFGYPLNPLYFFQSRTYVKSP
jgi:type II secretory pathway pseudopilin PulG